MSLADAWADPSDLGRQFMNLPAPTPQDHKTAALDTMETLDQETTAQYLLKRGLNEEIVTKLKDEGFNGKQFMSVDGQLLKLLNFSGSEIMTVLGLQNALRDQPILNDEEIEEDLRCTEKLKTFVENLDLLNQSSLYDKRVMCNQVEKYEAAVSLGCVELVHTCRPSFFTGDKENKNPLPKKTPASKISSGQCKRKTATTTPATRKSARLKTVPLPSQVLSQTPGTPTLEQQSATASVLVRSDSSPFSVGSDFASSPVGGTQSSPNLTRTKWIQPNQDRCMPFNFQCESESTSTSPQKSATASVPVPASPTGPLDFSYAQPLRHSSISNFADGESMSKISSSLENTFEHGPSSPSNLISAQASRNGLQHPSRSSVFHQPTAKVPVSGPPNSGVLPQSSSSTSHQQQTTRVPVSTPNSGLLPQSSSSTSHQQQTTRVPVSTPNSGLLPQSSSCTSHQQQTTRVPVSTPNSGLLPRSSSSTSHQQHTTRVPVSTPNSGLLPRLSSSTSHRQHTTRVPVSAPNSDLLARLSCSTSHQQQTTRDPVFASNSGLSPRSSSSTSHQQLTTRVPVSAPNSDSLAQSSCSTSHQQRTTCVQVSGSTNSDLLARMSSEVTVEEMRKFKPHLPSYDVNSILEARAVDGQVSSDHLKTLKETGYLEKKGRIWAMKCLAAYLYQESVDKSQNERVTMDMKEGMAKSFVLAYRKFAKTVRASDTEMPWRILLDVRQPSGCLYYSCRPFMKKDRVRKSTKRNADDDTSHLNENEVIDRLAVAYPGDSAAEKQVIFEGMKDTFHIREKERQEGKSIESFTEKYVHFTSYNGEVIRAEMRLLRPKAQDMCRVFNKLMPAILMLEPLKPIRLVLKDDVLKALMLISQHLPHDIPLSKRDTSGCVPKEENLLVVATPSDNIKDIIMKKRADATATEDTVQPYLITVQNPVSKKIMETFLILDNKAVMLKVPTLLHGIDFLFSSYFIFNASYPFGWRNTFHFLQTCFYEIFEGNRDKINNQEYLLLSKIYALLGQ